MRKGFVAYLVLPTVIAIAAMLGLHTSAQTPELPKPDAPLVMAAGESVSIVWGLPPKPKPEIVVIYRGTSDGQQFAEVGRVDASLLRFTDETVTLGQTYQYRVQTLKGTLHSALSEPAEVLVGGSAKITFLGGSLDRALFEVVLFRRGTRVSAQFVQKTGDAIGDLAYVNELDSVEDFRLGPTLTKLAIGVAESSENASLTIDSGAGQPLKDVAGRDVRIEFRFPGATHEIMIATLTGKDGKTLQLKEGESYSR
ncbi:MAG: hypothetical protein H6839_03220 [Planctomycetes bacterium]|nr:hypothetical protein [Planctomycetota bacterium]